MKRLQIILAVLLAVIAGLVLVLALRNPAAPFLPADDDHSGRPETAVCMDCHGPDSPLPRSKTHPLGDDCYRCHARR
jgi:hypothetical protein